MASTIEMKKLSSKNIVSPKGFTAAGVHCGIKHKKKDLAVLISEVPASVAGVFTTNAVQAAPKCFGKNMEFFCFSDLTELRVGAFGILEPPKEKPAFPDENTLMLVPGMAFDRNMNRIGYGGGYYDRYFEKYRDIAYFKLGLAHEFQIYDSLEVEEHDYRIDGVVSSGQNSI